MVRPKGTISGFYPRHYTIFAFTEDEARNKAITVVNIGNYELDRVSNVHIVQRDFLGRNRKK